MTETYLTEEEVRELHCASEDETNDEHRRSFDNDGECDKFYPTKLLVLHGVMEKMRMMV